MLWKIKLGLLLALLQGCGSVPEKEYVTVYVDNPIICNVPSPELPNFVTIEYEKILDVDAVWWIVVDDDNYKKLALNNGKLLKYTTDATATNTALRSCITTKKES